MPLRDGPPEASDARTAISQDLLAIKYGLAPQLSESRWAVLPRINHGKKIDTQAHCTAVRSTSEKILGSLTEVHLATLAERFQNPQHEVRYSAVPAYHDTRVMTETPVKLCTIRSPSRLTLAWKSLSFYEIDFRSKAEYVRPREGCDHRWGGTNHAESSCLFERMNPYTVMQTRTELGSVGTT